MTIICLYNTSCPHTPLADDRSVMDTFLFIFTSPRRGWVIFTQNSVARGRLLRWGDGVFSVHNRTQDNAAIPERGCWFRVMSSVPDNIAAKGVRGERVFMEKVYRSSKWWEVKGWGESVSELVIGKKNNNKKLYTVLSCWGVFTFCTCCKILICLVCIVASFKLFCV